MLKAKQYSDLQFQKLTCASLSGVIAARVNGMNVALNYVNDDLATVKSKIGSLGFRYTVSVFDVTNENDNSILICSGNPI